jgi:peptidoglycan/xylan/chitin deacetylase (PgdA/CDA1 family)
VLLTFDAGADRGHTARILDELARQGVRAAFGITGKWAESNSDLVARVHREGHELINHSYDHASFTGASWSTVARTREARTSQLATTERVVGEITGASAHPYFRPPFGDYDNSVLSDVGGAGYVYTVMWTVDSMGWRGWDAARITQRCLEGAAPGAIYIFHVGASSRDADALPAVIDGLRARGYEFASLADLLGVSPS